MNDNIALRLTLTPTLAGAKAAASFLENTFRADALRNAIDRSVPSRVSNDPMSANGRRTFNSHLPPMLKSWRLSEEPIRAGPTERFKPPKGKALCYRSYGTDGVRNCDGRLDAWGGSTQPSLGATRGAEAWLAGSRPLTGTQPPGAKCYRTERMFENLYGTGEALVPPNEVNGNPI